MSQPIEKNTAAVNTATDENNEIDRIMKEIEDLEQNLDEPAVDAAPPTPEAKIENNATGDKMSTEPEKNENENNVVAIRPKSGFDEAFEATGTDSVENEESYASESGTLSLKVGGATEVNLSFEKAGVAVSFSCTDDGLVITTDQGAEFRIPFGATSAAKKAA